MMDKNTQNDITEGESTLFVSQGAATSSLDGRRKKSVAKKQRIAIIVLTAVIAAALAAYFCVVLPIVNHVEETPEETVELLDGEALATNNRILMYEHYEREDISKIEVHNEYGKYGFYYDSEDGEFYVLDHASAPYDEELFASLVVSTGYTITEERVHSECEDMSEYGLDASQSPAHFTMTTRKGESYTVYIGNLTASGTGYYARLEGRSSVYVLGSSVGDTVLMPLEVLITPQLTLPLGTNEYLNIQNFAMMDGKNTRVMITRLEEQEQTDAALTTSYAMLAPANYSVNSTNYNSVTEQLGSFVGASTVKLAPSDEELSEYGLLEPAYAVYFTYRDAEQMVVFSQKNENGNYYAYSVLFDLIAEVEASSAEWIEWDLIKWVDYSIFLMNINDVKSITVESDTGVRIFDLEGESTELTVTERETGFEPDVNNFRQFYKDLLSIYVQGYVSGDLTDAEVAELVESAPYLTLSVETRAGKTTVYRFYPYSTRRAYYTVNGEGIFYVLRDMATKVISDCEKVMTDTAVDAAAKS